TVSVNQSLDFSWTLKAVAFDNYGGTATSAPVEIGYYTGLPTEPVLQITSPFPGSVFLPGATVVFSAELIASTSDTGPGEFFIDTNSVGSVTQGGTFTASTPLNSLAVSNLVEGQHILNVKYRGLNGPGKCAPVSITVASLGIQFPRRTTEGEVQFDVVTAF